MRPVEFPEQTRVLGPPAGCGQDEVTPLPICDTHDSMGRPMVMSVWELSDADIEALVRDRKLYFSMWGKTHPPIYLSTQNLFEGL